MNGLTGEKLDNVASAAESLRSWSLEEAQTSTQLTNQPLKSSDVRDYAGTCFERRY